MGTIQTYAIIPVAYLDRELPSDSDDTNSAETNAILEATDFCNTHADKYDRWPAHTDNGDGTYVINAPRQVQRICTEVSKAMFWMGQGQINRDGTEDTTWEEVLNFYEDKLNKLSVEPTIYSVAISLDGNGVQLLARNQNILPYHTESKVTSLTTNIWNQGYHWNIRRGLDADDEYTDGWYFDAEQYSSSIEGTIYFARSWRADGLDYLRFTPVVKSLN